MEVNGNYTIRIKGQIVEKGRQTFVLDKSWSVLKNICVKRDGNTVTVVKKVRT